MKFLTVLFWAWLSVPLILVAQKSSEDVYYLYLIGDGGEPTVKDEAYRQVIEKLRSQNAIPSSVVYLGDNVYPRGLERDDHKGRTKGEQTLQSQIDIGRQMEHVFVIPGNHDWKRGRRVGLDQLMNQQAWIDSLGTNSVQFLPRDGCPGPVEVNLTSNLTLIIIDSQWWLHPWDKPAGENSLCDVKDPKEIIAALEDILQRNENKQVVIAAHHPVYTYGEHGGVSTLRDHLFPLTNAHKSLYIPMPGIGSIYPFYRKIFGNIQDVAHPVYRNFRVAIEGLLKNYPGVIYASGHEHSLQYIAKDSVHYVVSGAGSKSTHVKLKGFAQFAKDEVGFVRVVVMTDNRTRIEYFTNESEAPVFTMKSNVPIKNEAEVIESKSEKTVRVSASQQYQATKRKERWLGKNYRAEWAQPVEVPVFDFQSADGELKIIQKGGGQQTLSLRLENAKGRQYTLRSIEKYPEKAIPEVFRETFAKDIVQDQISASHPYAALVVPKLADAAGVYHTNPKVVWLADDPRLGSYRKIFANRLMLFEERPSGSAAGMDFFGNADDVVSTFKVIEKLAKDNDNHVDQQFVLKSRLFDLLIGDWDRHDDQWRWAEFDQPSGKLYRPIPRDRDQTFFVNEGRLPKLVSKRWVLPKLQGFDYEIDWTPGFMFNGRYFDRSFLTAMEKDDWIGVADDLKNSLTDDVIEEAVRQWPTEIFDLHGNEIIAKLKSRREKLRDYALEHYYFLAKAVDVVGSDKHELFKINYGDHGAVAVKVFKTKKDGEVAEEIYSRVFDMNETQEIRLYGLEGKDRFEFSGTAKTKIKVRVIGGKGEDQFVSTASEKPLLYDKPNGIDVQPGSKLKDRRSSDPNVNNYNRREFRYNLLAPLVFGNFNVDDGLFLGGGFLATTHGFRKDPFKARHIFLGSYAINTSSFNFQYTGQYTNMIRKWGGELEIGAKSPNFVNNFFGLGNESLFDKNIEDNPLLTIENSIDYYRLRFTEWTVDMKLSRRIGGYGFLKAGPSLQIVELERSSKDRFIKDFETTLSEPILEVYKRFAGLSYSWGIDMRNSATFTTRGLYFEQSSKWMDEFDVSSVSEGTFGYHTAALALYHSFRIPARLTFAARVSGGISRGDFQIYQSQILDGKTELRGFRKTRFYGDSKLVFNNEVRFKLGEIHSYILPASIGLLGFYDVGRVWYKDDSGVDPTAASGKSKVWHKGFGGGVWLTPFNMAVVSTEVGHSVEGTLAYLRLGFLF